VVSPTALSSRDQVELQALPQLPDSHETRRRFIEIYSRGLQAQGTPRIQAETMAAVAYERARNNIKRPTPLLSGVAKVLKATESIPSGFVSGFLGAGPRTANPWDYIASLPHQVAAGYHEAGAALHGGAGFGEYIADAHPNNAFLTEHAGSIGFGLSLLFDPTMYLSFGATTASKIEANALLAQEARRSMRQAQRVLSRRGGWYNNGTVMKKYTDPIELAEAIHVAEGRPQTLGQALDLRKGVGLQYKTEARAFQHGVRSAIAGYALPTAVRGGRGARFAGLEIPGTARAGEVLGQQTRRIVREAPLGSFTGRVTRGFITSPEMKVMGDDKLRALAMSEMATFRASLQRARVEAEDIGTSMARATRDIGAPTEAPIIQGTGLEAPPGGPITKTRRQQLMASPVIRQEAMPELKFTVQSQGALNELYDALKGEHRFDTDQFDQFLTQFEEAIHPSFSTKDFKDMAPADPEAAMKAVGDLAEWATSIPATPKALRNVDKLINRLYRSIGGDLTVKQLKSLAAPRTTTAADFLTQRVKEGEAVVGKGEPLTAEETAQLRAPEKTLADYMKPRVVGIKGGTAEENALIREVYKRAQEQIELSKQYRIPQRNTYDLWRSVQRETTDPVEAIAHFWFANQVRVRAREFIDRITEDPLFSRKLAKNDEIPEGYTVFYNYNNQRYAVVSPVANALEELKSPAALDHSTSSVFKLLNLPQNYWKQFATSPNPSFHVMNFLGAMWNNFFNGVYNPADYIKALAEVYRSHIEEAALRGQPRVMGRRVKSTARTRESLQLMREARVRGATSETSSIFAELAQGVGERREMVSELPPSVRERLEDLVKPRRGEKPYRYGTRQLRRGTAAALTATGNPIGVALLAPEIARAGTKLGRTIEDIVRLAPFMKAAKDPLLKGYLEHFGPILVPENIHPSFTKADQSVMYDIGAEISKYFQFDYSDLTNFERRVAKTIFPFYTFYRKNFVLQAKLMAQAPRGTVGALRFINYMNQNNDISDPMRQLLPEYFDQLEAFQIPVPNGIRGKLGLPVGQPLFLNPKLPFLALNMMPPLWDVFSDTGQPTSNKVLGVFAPMLGSIGPYAPLPIPGMKTMLEAITGEQLGLNRTMDFQRAQSNDWRNSWVPAPSWVKYMPAPVRDFLGIFPWGQTAKNKQGNWIMTATGQYFLGEMTTPFVTNLGQTIPIAGSDPGKARADMVSWLTGVRLIPVDMLRIHRAWAYRLQSLLESRQADLKDRGLNLDPEDMQSLRRVRLLVKSIERAWDAKQRELYPDKEP